MFQYPLRVEMDWNSQAPGDISSPAGLFQYPLRVEMDWNGTRALSAVHPQRFQYPLRVEMDWNDARIGQRRLTAGFQYPLRVEMDWNSGVVAGFGAGSAVSVPSAGRNGLEPSRDTSAISLRPAFQYPLRV